MKDIALCGNHERDVPGSASADMKNQPWLIFAAHRVLGYSSDYYFALSGLFAEPEGRES
ncbi:putative phosphodiesterase I [Helianthus anomalus]